MSYSIWDSSKEFFDQNYGDIRLYLLYSLSAPIFEVGLPHFYGRVIDNLSHFPADKAFICNKTNIITIGSLWILCQILNRQLDNLDARFIPKLTGFFRADVVQKILFFYEKRSDDPKIGELLTKIIRLPSVMRDIFNQIRTYILPTTLIMIFATLYLFYIDKGLGILMIIGIVTFLTVLKSFIKESLDKIDESFEEYDEVHEEIIDLLTNTTSIYSSGMLEKELQRLINKQEKYGETLKQSIEFVAKFKTIFNAAYFGIFTSISAYALNLYSKKKITLAQNSSVLIVLLFCIVNLTDVSNGIRDFIFNIGSLIGLQKFLNTIFTEEPNQISNKLGNHPNLNDLEKNSICFKDVSISYNNKKIFENFNATIHFGKLTVLVGDVGAGKSTLIKAILKSKNIDSGDIYITGVPQKEHSAQTIRKRISYVPQHPNLFNRSVLENIVYGTNATKNDVIEILKLNSITEIKDSDLSRNAGKNGCNLSGGQKQIVLILRFLLKSASIMILDEPTSNLSTSSKKSVIQLLHQAADMGKIVIVVSHDKDMIQQADVLLKI